MIVNRDRPANLRYAADRQNDNGEKREESRDAVHEELYTCVVSFAMPEDQL